MEERTRRTTVTTAVVGGIAAVAAVLFFLFGYNPEWNHGRDPTDPHHPNPTIDQAFDPKYTMLLYLDMEDSFGSAQDIFRVRAIKLQFRSENWKNPSNNTWEKNQQRVAQWINHLNAGNPPPPQQHDQMYVSHGLKEFVFNQPHHVVIYIQNRDIDYNNQYPVWFSDVLINSMSTNPPDKAAKNFSFFGAKVDTPRDANGNPAIIGPYNTQVIYMKNFFRRENWLGYPEITHRQSYSLNINVLGKVTDLLGNPVDTSGQAWANIIPFIIDPDTGNMGGGDPPR